MSEDPRRTQPFCTPTCFRECQCTRWPDMIDRWGNPVNHGSGGGDEPPEVFALYIDWLNGNDANDGLTEATALKTLAHCLAAHAVNGDKIGILGHAVADEIYYESAISTALTNITIKAVSGHSPIFSTSTKYTGWVLTGGTANVYEKAMAGAFGVWNGSTFLKCVANVVACDAAMNSWYFAAGVLYVNIGGADPDTVGGLNVNTTAAFVLTANGTGITIDGLYNQWCMRGLSIVGTNGTVQNCTLRYMNQVAGSPYGAVVVTGNGSVVDNCTINELYGYATSDTGIHVAGQCVSLEVAVGGATVRNCALGHARFGVQVISGANNVVEYNTIDETYANAIEILGGGTLVRYNVGTDIGAGMVRCANASVNVVHHNVLTCTKVVPAATGARYGYILEHTGTSVFYHNIAANLLDDPAGRHGFYLQGTAVGTFYNNIAYRCATGLVQDAGGSTLTADYNCTNSNTSNYGGTLPWPPGANDVVADPLFTDGPNDVFTLQAGSPCLNAGTFVAGYSELGPPTDIGRWES